MLFRKVCLRKDYTPFLEMACFSNTQHIQDYKVCNKVLATHTRCVFIQKVCRSKFKMCLVLLLHGKVCISEHTIFKSVQSVLSTKPCSFY